MAGFTFGDLARGGLTAQPRTNARETLGAGSYMPAYASATGAAGNMGGSIGQPAYQPTRQPPIVTPAGPGRLPQMSTPDPFPAGGSDFLMPGSPPQFGGMPGPSGGMGAPGANGGATINSGMAGFGGMPPPSPTAGGSQTIATNPIGSQGQANYGPNAGPDWRKGYTGNAADLQGAQGKVNIGMWNAQQQNARDAAAHAASAARNAGFGHNTTDMSGDGSGLHGQAKVNAILAQGNQQSQDDPAQMQRWATSTNPLEIEGKPLETWNPAQLQAGLSYYTQQQANAVPGSNEWNMYQDRINSIQQNMSGNRTPWAYPSQNGPGYFNNNAGTPTGGWNLGGGPRS